MFRKHHLHLHIIFIHEKNIVYTYLFLIMLITLITSGSLNDAFVLNANDMLIKVMFIWTFWHRIYNFLSSYELVMNFQSFGQTVKGHSRDLDGKSKGKTEQARKVRAKPVGRNQLGVKMQLSQLRMPGPHGVITTNGNTEHSLRTEAHTTAITAEVQSGLIKPHISSAIKPPVSIKWNRSILEVD